MSNYRAPIRTIQSDFRAGEIDPLFSMRVDSTAYPSGARRLTNMLLRTTGSAERRPGTATYAQLVFGRTRLIGFEFDLDEKYLCGFYAGGLTIYDPNGTALVNFPTEPWNSTTLWEINVVQKGDVMIIVHPSFKMKELRRTGATTFTLAYIEFSSDTSDAVLNQPYMKYGAATITVGISDYSIGSGRTLTSNTAIFNANWVGDRIRIYNCEMVVTAYVNSTTVTVSVLQEIRKRLDPAPFRFTDGSNVAEVTHALHGLTTGATVNISGATDFFTLNKASINGNRVVTVIDEDRYTVVMASNANDSGDGGGPSVFIKTTAQTRDWMEPVWSWRRGWPGAIALHENRIWMAGSTAAPTFLAGSTIGSYYDFNLGDGFDDESVQGQISTLARIRHLVSAKTLQIFTEISEAVIDTQQGNPITPGSLKVVTNSSYGIGNVPPKPFDGATLFIQRTGKNIRELVYDFNSDTWVGVPVSLLANHIIAQPRDMAVLAGTTTRSEQYAFIVNANGTVACFHSARSEKLEAWTQFICGGGGLFDSVCVIGSSVYFSVLRDGFYWLERFELDASNIWLDSAVVPVAGPPTTAWALGTRFANKTVSVMARLSGHYLGDYVADASGNITLPTAVVSIIAGYDYDVAVTPLPPDKEMTDGAMTGEIRRIVSATIHFHNSVSAAVNGNQTIGFSVGDDPSLPPRAISGKRRIRLLGYGRDPEINITQPAPGPLTVLGLSLEVSI